MKRTFLLLTVLVLAGCDAFPEYVDSADQSYYIPAHGTVNIHLGPSPIPAGVTGDLSEDIIVLSDLGESIERINADGSTAWRRFEYGVRVVGLTRWDDSTISYIRNSTVVLLDIETGAVVDQFDPIPDKKLWSFERVDGGYLASIYEPGYGRIQLLDENFRRVWANPHYTNYSRDAILVDGVVIIAETYGHRVFGVEITSGAILFEYNEYYPGQAVDLGGELLITGEHSNRVYRLNPETGVRSPVHACSALPYANLYSTSDEIIALEEDEARPLLINPNEPTTSPGICQGELYSPNGAAPGTSGNYFIADTDNGRVLEIDASGAVVAVIEHFNNPAQVLAVGG